MGPAAKPYLDVEDGQKLLQQVSRSFALTIPQLPPALRKAVTNAYLLCRILDTIEDEETLSLKSKEKFFQEFRNVMNGKGSPEDFAKALHPLLSGRTLPEEKELIRNTGRVIATTRTLNESQQETIKECAEIMCRGMLEFQKAKSDRGLEDLSAFDGYCYHVAGVVGEMLTRLFCEYSPEIARHRESLMRQAVSFGKGLQMTNIIKDLWEDREHDACWLPRDVFQKAGYDLGDLSSGVYTDAFDQGLTVLLGLARSHLRNALAYTLKIPRHETGIRKFCLWAIGMAVLTLRKINRKRDYRSGREVKISRRTVKAVILVTNASLRSNLLLKALFGLTTIGLPGSASSAEDRPWAGRIFENP
jgi:farnesyl-diphosphate farnesyltransferase